jgi:hypothetical protein
LDPVFTKHGLHRFGGVVVGIETLTDARLDDADLGCMLVIVAGPPEGHLYLEKIRSPVFILAPLVYRFLDCFANRHLCQQQFCVKQ